MLLSFLMIGFSSGAIENSESRSSPQAIVGRSAGFIPTHNSYIMQNRAVPTRDSTPGTSELPEREIRNFSGQSTMPLRDYGRSSFVLPARGGAINPNAREWVPGTSHAVRAAQPFLAVQVETSAPAMSGLPQREPRNFSGHHATSGVPLRSSAERPFMPIYAGYEAQTSTYYASAPSWVSTATVHKTHYPRTKQRDADVPSHMQQRLLVHPSRDATTQNRQIARTGTNANAPVSVATPLYVLAYYRQLKDHALQQKQQEEDDYYGYDDDWGCSCSQTEFNPGGCGSPECFNRSDDKTEYSDNENNREHLECFHDANGHAVACTYEEYREGCKSGRF